MGRCAAVIDQAAALDACIQDSCNSWEVQGACSNLNVYADKVNTNLLMMILY